MSDKITIEVLRSAGKDCLAVGDTVVAGAWAGQGTTYLTFKVSIEKLESLIAERKRQQGKHEQHAERG